LRPAGVAAIQVRGRRPSKVLSIVKVHPLIKALVGVAFVVAGIARHGAVGFIAIGVVARGLAAEDGASRLRGAAKRR
jgi:hypothetical protein